MNTKKTFGTNHPFYAFCFSGFLPPTLCVQLPPSPPPPRLKRRPMGKAGDHYLSYLKRTKYAQTLCAGQQNYQKKLTADRWTEERKECKLALLSLSAITRSTLRVFTS